jgi:predicted nucleotidyltransferase
MDPEYQKAIKIFKDNLEKKFGDQVKKVILFGSVTKGEVTRESDIDILVVMDKINEKTEKEIFNIAFEAGRAIRTIIVPIILSSASYMDMLKERYPFIMNVEKEGVAIA